MMEFLQIIAIVFSIMWVIVRVVKALRVVHMKEIGRFLYTCGPHNRDDIYYGTSLLDKHKIDRALVELCNRGLVHKDGSNFMLVEHGESLIEGLK